MGLFGRKIKYTDRVWLDQAHKFKDILNAITAAKKAHLMPLCFFHFANTAEQFKGYLHTSGIHFHQLNSLSELDISTPESWLARTDIILIKSNLINKHHTQGSKRGSPGIQTPYALHLIERYPIPDRDDAILTFVTKHRDIAPPIAYTALDEAWLTQLMGERLKSLLKTLEVDENECMEHSMISASIRNAQEKMAAKVRRDYPYDSIEEWLSGNIES